ncbi:hypothetical protein JW756_01315 [Candidatus Woesearchaeota archaeon]|nr:hypothetical protein [Candidatus Woesearchaeota archaeon]
MTGFMGKKVNLFLLLMLMLVLLGFAGVSVYYQYTFKNLNSQFENVSGVLGYCEQNLNQTTNSFMSALKNLNSTETDIRKYDKIFEDKVRELEQKKSELASTQADLTRVTMQKEVYKKQIDEAYAQLISLNKTVTSLNTQVNSLNREVDRLNTRVACLRNTDDTEEASDCFS